MKMSSDDFPFFLLFVGWRFREISLSWNGDSGRFCSSWDDDSRKYCAIKFACSPHKTTNNSDACAREQLCRHWRRRSPPSTERRSRALDGRGGPGWGAAGRQRHATSTPSSATSTRAVLSSSIGSPRLSALPGPRRRICVLRLRRVVVLQLLSQVDGRRGREASSWRFSAFACPPFAAASTELRSATVVVAVLSEKPEAWAGEYRMAVRYRIPIIPVYDADR